MTTKKELQNFLIMISVRTKAAIWWWWWWWWWWRWGVGVTWHSDTYEIRDSQSTCSTSTSKTSIFEFIDVNIINTEIAIMSIDD